MKKIATTVAMLLMAAATALPAPASAASMFGWSGNMSNYCERHPRDRDCWDRRDHRRGFGFGNFAAGIIGFAVGAAVVNSLNNRGSSWESDVARCEAHFQSYDDDTDLYLGFDGDYHRCRL